MQARLQTVRTPFRPVAVVLVLAVAIMLGIALGYGLKPAVHVSSPGSVTVLTAGSIPDDANLPCVFVNKHKEC